MINNNFFVGPLGKLHNIGCSRAFSTPNTIVVPPEYSIEVNSNIQGKLAVHSLDGRLWIFKNESTLYAVALKWNADTAKLEFATVKTFSNNSDTFLARGLDWVLSNNNIFLVSDDEPYIYSANLFDANTPNSFLYSVLRSNGIGSSAIDPITNQAWGKRDDNGNSNGLGLFSKNNHLLFPPGTHTFEQCYSLLPPIGDWLIFENFLIRRPLNPIDDSYNFMLNVRPLIPLEICNHKIAFGTGYNFDHRGIQLTYKNGKIWAKGFYNIGQISLLPAVFDLNGETLEFYLYIHPDFICSPLSHEQILTEEALSDMGYKIFNGHTFKFFQASFSWQEADAACKSIGGHLATSTSYEKNNFLSSFYEGWIALGGRKENNSWAWDNGETWSFSNWDNNYPTTKVGRDFIFMRWGKWQNLSATYRASYICEWDYDFSSTEHFDEWFNLCIAITDNNSPYGFLAQTTGSLLGATCFTADELKFFDPENNSWLDFQSTDNNNSKLFIDTTSAQSMLLHDNGAEFFEGVDQNKKTIFRCHTLNQWMLPAGRIVALLNSCVISSLDNSVLACHTQNGFYREFLKDKNLLLSLASFNGKRFSLGHTLIDGQLTIHANSFECSSHFSPIAWEDFYKQFFSFNMLRSFPASQMPQKFGPASMPLFLYPVEEIITIVNETVTFSKSDAVSGWIYGEWVPSPDEPNRAGWVSGEFPLRENEWGYDDESYPSLPAMESATGLSVNIDDWQDWGTKLQQGTHEAGNITWHFVTIDFDSGQFVPVANITAPIMAIVQTQQQKSKSFSYSFDWNSEYWYIDWEASNEAGEYVWKCDYEPNTATVSGALSYNVNKIIKYEKPSITIKNGKFCVRSLKSLNITEDETGRYELPEYEETFYDIPDTLLQLADIEQSKAPIASYEQKHFLLKFQEPITSIPFYIRVSSEAIHDLLSFIDLRSLDNRAGTYLRTLILFRINNEEFVYFIQLIPTIFDFYNEAQRSITT